MIDRTSRMSVVCAAAVMVSSTAPAQAIQVDLILEKTLASPVHQVGIDYEVEGRPLFTMVSEAGVEVMDSEGATTAIESGFTALDWASCSPNGGYVGIFKGFALTDTLTGMPHLRNRFILKDRTGRIVYEFPDAPFNDAILGNDGSIATTVLLSFTSAADDWWLYDPNGTRTGEIGAGDIKFFGNSGSFFTCPGPVAVYTAGLNQLWSFDPVSPSLHREAIQASSDGRYLVRASRQGLEMYKDGELVKVDSTLAGVEGPYYPVFITPDDRHALVSAGHRAFLYDLGECTRVRTYSTTEPRRFGWASASTNGDYVLLNMYVKAGTAIEDSVVLFNETAQVVWQIGTPLRGHGTPWLSMDPQARYITLWDDHKLWLYKAR